MTRRNRPIPIIPAPERECSVGNVTAGIMTILICGPFVVAIGMLGIAFAIKATRLLYDVAITWGAA
jgi:hypothetical protein